MPRSDVQSIGDFHTTNREDMEVLAGKAKGRTCRDVVPLHHDRAGLADALIFAQDPCAAALQVDDLNHNLLVPESKKSSPRAHR